MNHVQGLAYNHVHAPFLPVVVFWLENSSKSVWVVQRWPPGVGTTWTVALARERPRRPGHTHWMSSVDYQGPDWLWLTEPPGDPQSGHFNETCKFGNETTAWQIFMLKIIGTITLCFHKKYILALIFLLGASVVLTCQSYTTIQCKAYVPVVECSRLPFVEPVSRYWYQVALSPGCAQTGSAWEMR